MRQPDKRRSRDYTYVGENIPATGAISLRFPGWRAVQKLDCIKPGRVGRDYRSKTNRNQSEIREEIRGKNDKPMLEQFEHAEVAFLWTAT